MHYGIFRDLTFFPRDQNPLAYTVGSNLGLKLGPRTLVNSTVTQKGGGRQGKRGKGVERGRDDVRGQEEDEEREGEEGARGESGEKMGEIRGGKKSKILS